MTAKETVQAIRERFPEPQSAVVASRRADATGCYCVGGALMLTCCPRSPQRFPGRYRLASALQHQNPRLDGQRAHDFADHIIKANDRGDFEAARAALEEALAFGGES